MNRQTKRIVLDLLDEFYEKRAEMSLFRHQIDLTVTEINHMEEQFDSYFKQVILKLENYISQE